MKFFFDNCLPLRLAEALQSLEGSKGHTVTHLRDMFDEAISDVEWIRVLAAEGDWIIISGDLRISQNVFERQAWRESGLTAFFLAKGWTTLPLWEQAWKLIKWWPAIAAQAERIKQGAGFIVPVSGAKLQQLSIP